MKTIRQSVSWWCYQRSNIPPEQLVKTIAEIGYAGIELVGEEYWPLIREHGLTIASVNGHNSIAEGLNRRENHDRIEREITARLEQAQKWNIPNLIVFSGNRAGLDDTTGAENTAEGLRRVTQAAEDAGVTLVLELLNSKVDHPDYQCDYSSWGVRVCEMVGSPRVRLLYDIYHMQIMEGDIIRTISAHNAFFGHYHTAGNPGRNEIDATQELNYPPIIRAILETGYAGFLGQEFVPRGDPIAGLREAFEICNLAV